jgi:hypothetical protein
VVPYLAGDVVFAPAGNLDDDPGTRPQWHMFVASRAPWYQITDALPRFEAYPPDMTATPSPDRPPLDPPGRPRGSCLCGAVRYVLDGAPVRHRYCHCGRCRKSLSTAHATNMTTTLEGVRFTAGEALLIAYKVPEAQHFTVLFCPRCGSPMPRRDAGRSMSMIPMGSLDDDPGIRPSGHIFVGSKAPWFEITDSLPQHAEYPPAG